jgi:hypothetical protein
MVRASRGRNAEGIQNLRLQSCKLNSDSFYSFNLEILRRNHLFFGTVRICDDAGRNVSGFDSCS